METGCDATAERSAFSSPLGTSLWPETVTTGEHDLVHVPVVPLPEVYGYACSVQMPPFSWIHSNALSISPPEQPWSPLWSHCTRSSSDREISLPVAIWYAPSTDPVVEKAQHEPHRCWFFTGVTAPFATQSTEAARGTSDARCTRSMFLGARLVKMRDMWDSRNWSHVRSENSLCPSVHDSPFALCSLMIFSFSEKAESAAVIASIVSYALPWSFFHASNLERTSSTAEKAEAYAMHTATTTLYSMARRGGWS
mmetsp:Transcript_17119/g.25782  ORF Transcript_17119/g.25782 Transcript_17119/m.25782 type:complete len:253 (+) Transcript_17119:745-1503(+)